MPIRGLFDPIRRLFSWKGTFSVSILSYRIRPLDYSGPLRKCAKPKAEKREKANIYLCKYAKLLSQWKGTTFATFPEYAPSIPQTRENIDWRWPLSCVHSVMMVFSSQLTEGGDARPPPFILSTPSRNLPRPFHPQLARELLPVLSHVATAWKHFKYKISTDLLESCFLLGPFERAMSQD